MRFVFHALCLLLAGEALAAPRSDYLAELTARARALQLDASAQWQRLLHYEARALGSGVRSTASTAFFFVSAAGRTDPRAELEATLAAFFESDNLAEREEPAQCA